MSPDIIPSPKHIPTADRRTIIKSLNDGSETKISYNSPWSSVTYGSEKKCSDKRNSLTGLMARYMLCPEKEVPIRQASAAAPTGS